MVDGCFNINLVEKADQAYAKACRAGTLWQVISNDVIHEFPQVADLLQAGQNTNVFKRESEYQILRRMVTWIGQQAQVSWNSVKYHEDKAGLRTSMSLHVSVPDEVHGP